MTTSPIASSSASTVAGAPPSDKASDSQLLVDSSASFVDLFLAGTVTTAIVMVSLVLFSDYLFEIFTFGVCITVLLGIVARRHGFRIYSKRRELLVFAGGVIGSIVLAGLLYGIMALLVSNGIE